jgi:NADH-quinone oxidoreductase subunit J
MIQILESITVGLIHNVLPTGSLHDFDFFYLLFFFLLKYLIIFSAVMVVISINAIYSVFFLILLFISVSVLTIAVGAEFLGITFIIVYVGAIAVLFLFVVMMLNVNQSELNSNDRTVFLYFVTAFILLLSFAQYLNGAIYQGFGFYSLLKPSEVSLSIIYQFSYKEWVDLIFRSDNILVLGSVLYTYYFHLFILAGFILLLAMVSSIVLTLNYTHSLKAQDKYIQVTRQLNHAVLVRN